MRIAPFKALVEEVMTSEGKNGHPYRRIILKVPAPVDQFTGEKRGSDQHYETFVFSPNLENMIIPQRGDKVEAQGYLNGKMHLSQSDSKIFYQHTLSLTDLKKL